jgi:hypothetical protein
MKFFGNLLLGEKNELKNRYMRGDYAKNVPVNVPVNIDNNLTEKLSSIY